jgi:hypothetical protein
MAVGGLRNTGIVQDGLVFSIDAYNSKSNQSIVNNLKSGISTGGLMGYKLIQPLNGLLMVQMII